MYVYGYRRTGAPHSWNSSANDICIYAYRQVHAAGATPYILLLLYNAVGNTTYIWVPTFITRLRSGNFH